MNDSAKGLTTEDVVKMNKKYLSDREVVDIQNMYIDNKGHWQKREGYNSFLGLIKMLCRLNKSNNKWGTKVNYTITLPIKWI